MTWQPTDKQVEAALAKFVYRPERSGIAWANMRAALLAAHEAGDEIDYELEQARGSREYPPSSVEIGAQARIQAFKEAIAACAVPATCVSSEYAEGCEGCAQAISALR